MRIILNDLLPMFPKTAVIDTHSRSITERHRYWGTDRRFVTTCPNAMLGIG